MAVKTDCFAYTSKETMYGKWEACKALNALFCKTEECKFYKTREQACKECQYIDCKGCVNVNPMYETEL